MSQIANCPLTIADCRAADGEASSNSISIGNRKSKIGNDWLRLGAVTLIELMMVVIIVGILGAMAMPRLSNVMRRQRLDMAGRQLMEDIQLARIQAIRDKSNTVIDFDLTNRRYTLQSQNGNRTSGGAYTVNLKVKGSDRIKLLSASFGGNPQLTFTKFGVPQSSGTVTITDGVDQQVLTVSGTTGRVSRSTMSYP